ILAWAGKPTYFLVPRRRRPYSLARPRAARPDGGVRPAGARQRGCKAFLPGHGHALSQTHRRALRRWRHGTPVVDAKLAQEYLHALKHQRRLAPATLANYARASDVLLALRGGNPWQCLQADGVRRSIARVPCNGLS